MPSRAYTSFLPFAIWFRMWLPCRSVNALSGLYLISTIEKFLKETIEAFGVSMPSRAYTSFLRLNALKQTTYHDAVSMPSRAYTSFLHEIDTSYHYQWYCVNALSGLYLISTVPLQKPRFYAVSRVCFCRYLSEYSDNSRFSCMLTFWTYLMRCTYLWHWIKYSTNYNRCHLIFSLSW